MVGKMNLVKHIVAAYVVIFFASLVIPNKIEIKINHHHDFSGNYNNDISVRYHFDFGRNLHKPICIELGNQATVPLKMDVKHKGNR